MPSRERHVCSVGSPVGEAPVEPVGFWLDLDVLGGRLTVRGRLDRGTAHLVHDAIAAMLTIERTYWTVDVAHLVVRDRFGLRLLTGAYRRLLRQGRRMTLEGASPELKHALTRLRLDHHVLPHGRGSSDGSTPHSEPTPPSVGSGRDLLSQA